MMHFFRKNQRIFFIILSVVIIVSFSFFGTYNTFSSKEMPDPIAFTKVDGRKVKLSELEAMVRFISSDAYDKLLFGGSWGPNFLNDGVVREDFLQTGSALLIVEPFREELKEELEKRLEKEKRYTAYTHPDAPFLNAHLIWEHYAPEIPSELHHLRAAHDPLEDRAFKARVQLFLEERKFPSNYLKQVLRYQEGQFKWINADSELVQRDLSLFGYHMLEDWFGHPFLQLISRFIMNGAALAEQKGYKVTDSEALASLIYNSESSFREMQQIQSPFLNVKNGDEYFSTQLRIMNMDQGTAVAIWKQVLLFRRLLNTVGEGVFVAPFAYQKFHEFAGENALVDLYQLPEPLRFSDKDSLQKFQIYLNAVSKGSSSTLDLPENFKSENEIAKTAPQIVQKRYLIEFSEVSQGQLALKVPLKEAWDWELKEENWKKLVESFPQLKTAKVLQSERFNALESLDSQTRAAVDRFAKLAIVSNHPEWINEFLQQAPSQKKLIGISLKGTTVPLKGVSDVNALQKLLDLSAIQADQNPSKEAAAARDKLLQWTGDEKIYYRIAVVERSPSNEVMTFAEASQAGVLDQLLEDRLEQFYLTEQKNKSAAYLAPSGDFKPFKEVRQQLADAYFAPISKAVKEDAVAHGETWNPLVQKTELDFAASHRFLAYMRDQKEKVQSAALKELDAGEKAQPSLKNQWELVKSEQKMQRGEKGVIDNDQPFSIAVNEWSSVYAPLNGNLYFFQLKERLPATDSVISLLDEGERLLGNEARRFLISTILQEMQAKNALHLQPVGDN